MPLARRRVLILGGSSDIGVELIKLFIKKKWLVTAHYNKNNKVLNKISSRYFKSINLDFFDINDKTINLINKKFDTHYDSIINLIGYTDNKSYNDFNIDDCLKSIKVNAIVPMFFIKKFSKKMNQRKWGRIVNCSSIGVKYGGGKNSFNYSISKQTLEFIPNVYKTWAKNNVYINTLRLGVVNTKLHKRLKNKNLDKRIKLIPANKMAQTKDIINLIYFLSSDDNQFITGEKITIAGGE